MNETIYQTGMKFWFVLYLVSCGVFFSIATWVIVRGARDVWEILTEAWINGKNQSP